MAITARKIERLKYWDAALACLKPPDEITVSEWADRYRILTSETSPEPGPYKTARTPYCKIPMDSFGNPDIEHVVLCWGAQVGKTDLLLNCLAYAIAEDPGPALFVMPTESLGAFISRNRIQPMVEACQKLRERKPSDLDEYQRLEMKFKGMVLSIIGANSPASLSHRPVRFLFRDEVNKFPLFAGKESDPMSLSRERTKNFWNRKIFDVSTPSIESGNITKELESCEVVFDFYLPCPHCGVYQILRFEQIKWPKREKDEEAISVDEAKKTAWYECEACKQSIADVHKNEMLRAGEWRSRGERCIEFGKYILAHHPRKVGFHLPAWYSPWLSWGDCAAEFLSSKNFPERLMNFRNSWEAEPWIDRIEMKSEKQIMRNIIDVPGGYVPKDYIALTAGVDPSDDGFFLAVLAWKRDLTCHLVGYDCLERWDQIRELVFDLSVPCEGSNNRLQIWRCLIDSGGGKKGDDDETMTEACYDFIRKNSRNQIFAAKGSSHPMPSKVIIKPVERDAKGPVRGGVILILVDSSALKDAINYRLDRPPGEPGRFTFHKETEMDYISHLFAEERRRNARTGLTQWVQTRRANHFLDCTVLAFACADPSFQGGIMRFREPRKEAAQPVVHSGRNFALDY